MVEQERDAEWFDTLIAESRKFTSLIRVPDNMILDIWQSHSDWEFILKLDALLEAAVRHVLKKSFAKAEIEPETMEAFVDGLTLRGGKSSALALMSGSGAPDNLVQFIDAVRTVRNGFAHDITLAGSYLIDVIITKNERSSLIRKLCYIENYDEKNLIESFKKDGRTLRFGMLTATLAFLIMAYHGSIKGKP